MYKERKRELGFWVVLTVIGHVEGGEAGVGVAKHSLNGVVSIDSAPSPTGLPHSVEDSAYVDGIVPVGERDSLSLLCSHGAALHARSGPSSSSGGGGGFDMREIGKDRFYSGCHCHCHCHCHCSLLCWVLCLCVVRIAVWIWRVWYIRWLFLFWSCCKDTYTLTLSFHAWE